MEPMIGMVFMIPWNWAPMNYALCQGQLLLVQQYMALYSLMGTSFGGDGRANFNLPDLQGRAPIGTGILKGGGIYQLGTKIGNENTTLGLNNLPVHNHGATFTAVTGSQTVTLPGQTGTLKVGINVASTAAGNASPSNTALLAASAGTNTKIYTSATATPAPATTPLADGATTVTGNAATAGQTFSVPTVTGGTVAIGNAGASQPFTNYQPSLAMSFVIALVGLYPDRP